ncbi:hypothetical protein BCR33DRAFT_742776 [Rhizoclosmatium globosum]|uniref:Hexosyltransferase n=1 Tax=Rhizoclosmatium globosum TaxID=329046 RepID=A0A1Y2BP51_9FUNG|nr:hypothetical protein BCR33DRAFT_742776 [Rhizoclosmatium globosum]|eukprot:ORY36521.1 hypothetical protein BCR33DRAFT_742776 [Rhizoclosmatium globosum]
MDPIDTAHRHILREKYEIFNSQLPEPSRIEFKFVFGIPNTTEQIRQLEKERTEFPNDIVVVNRPESRDTGKILDWFRYARGTGYWWHSLRGYCPRYRYIGKADIDAVIHIPRLLQMIEALPTSIPNFMGRRSYTHLTGMLYLLSTSLVEWIHFSKDVQQHVVGIEDTVVGDWVKNSGINVNWADMGRTFHDLPDSPNWCPGVITNKTVVVHWCKDESHFQQCIGGLLDGESQSRKAFGNGVLNWVLI